MQVVEIIKYYLMNATKVIDLSSNDELEKKSSESKEANSIENYKLHDSLDCILVELKEIVKQLKKINK